MNKRLPAGLLSGLGHDFILDWQKAPNDFEMIQEQDEIVDGLKKLCLFE